MSIDPNFNKFTYEHYVLIPNDGNRHEIVDGDHFMNPAPNSYHQLISGRLYFQLYSQITLHKLGLVFVAPINVQLSEFDIVQPDLVVVLNDRKSILTKPKIDGVPSLIIEIVSPSNANHDRDLKKKLYQRVEVPEYWIVDPDAELIEQFVLEGQRFVQKKTVGGEIPIQIVPKVSINTTGLWNFDF